MSLNTAVGLSTIPYVLRSARNIVTKSHVKLFGGSSAITEFAGMVVSFLAGYATLAGASFSDVAMKAFAAMLLLPGIIQYVAPKNTFGDASKKGNQDGGKPGSVRLFNRNYGDNMLINGAFYMALALGCDIFQSFAACWFVAAAGMGYMAAMDMPAYEPSLVGPTFGWVVICVLIATVMSL